MAPAVRYKPPIRSLYEMLTFGIPCVILAMLYVAARHSPAGRRALTGVLVAFVAGGLPLALEFYKWRPAWELWKGIARGFAALPLT